MRHGGREGAGKGGLERERLRCLGMRDMVSEALRNGACMSVGSCVDGRSARREYIVSKSCRPTCRVHACTYDSTSTYDSTNDLLHTQTHTHTHNL